MEAQPVAAQADPGYRSYGSKHWAVRERWLSWSEGVCMCVCTCVFVEGDERVAGGGGEGE